MPGLAQSPDASVDPTRSASPDAPPPARSMSDAQPPRHGHTPSWFRSTPLLLPAGADAEIATSPETDETFSPALPHIRSHRCVLRHWREVLSKARDESHPLSAAEARAVRRSRLIEGL